ncbi:MAG: ATPase, T2SS/T4P/T4SS family [Lachnospiraceae bacterium]|nr:ATPase, T2SS/T4P/T4SS family [Lachnospiraceae bacterium]
MRVERKRMGDMLLAEGAVTQEQIEEALTTARRDGVKMGEKLVELGYVTEDTIAQVLSNQLKIERVHLSEAYIDESFVKLIQGDVLRKYSMIPLAYDKENVNRVQVAMSDPMDMGAMDEFSIITNLQVEPVIATKFEIDTALDRYYSDAETAKVLERYKMEHQELEEQTEDEGDSQQVDNSPVVLLVRSMMQQAARQNASDIHIEALERAVRVRFRIDGVLYERFRYDIEMLPAIIARIKIIGGMDISEKRKPQDGRITLNVDHNEFDIRVSILPTVYGEKCVMRLAQKNALARDKSELGLTGRDVQTFDELLKNPNGILLVTGPTGSGKTTTLYTVLHELNTEDVNIITVEDPVEANINGINQVQVNPKADLTFANALRSILRQDPDIIMIGEIRDGETAKIAVQASITGHLVVSTLHTNSTAGAIVRLMDMGVENYLLADSVFGVIAQRLVRTLCPECRRERPVTEQDRKDLGVGPFEEIHLYEPCGCEKCGRTGFTGRVGVYEILRVTPRIRELIHNHASADEIRRVAIDEGMLTLHHNAKQHVLNGVTTLNEMLRITYEND